MRAPFHVAVGIAITAAPALAACQDSHASNSERDTHMGDIRAAAPPTAAMDVASAAPSAGAMPAAPAPVPAAPSASAPPATGH